MPRLALLVCILLLPLRSALGQTPPGPPPYRDARLPVARRAADLLSRMTREEKFWQLFMIPGDLDDSTHDYSHGVFGLQIAARGSDARAHAERINAIQRYFVTRTRLGIPIIPFDEAVHGLLQPGATVFPQSIGLAATWDTALVGRVAAAIAGEVKSRGIRQVLSPVVNVASDVRWGRVEETYGEDPLLAARMGSAFVAAFERAGVIATPKHFVANVGAGGRDSYPIDFDRRVLEEIFFPPFTAALRAGARSVMTAYNAVNGDPATQSRWLLTDVLKREWGFPGFVISDQSATSGAVVLHGTEPSTAAAARHALNAGLDVIFQSAYPQYRPYLDAFRQGLIPDTVIDAAVTRVLRAKLALGLFEHPYVTPESAAVWNGPAAHRVLAREAARAGIVLLKNARGTLPLPALRALAVIGTDAAEPRLGGYSGPGIHPVSILDGLRERLGARVVRYAPGPGRSARAVVPVPGSALRSAGDSGSDRGLRAEYFANPQLDGAPRVVRTDARVDFSWTWNAPARGIANDWYSVRWTGTLTAPGTGARRLGVTGTDGYRLWLDDSLVIDNWRKESVRTTLAAVVLEPGRPHALRLEFHETAGNARLTLVWDAGAEGDGQAAIDSAVALARASDAAVIVAGSEEGEFRDRASLRLPGRQEDLIQAVAATGKPVTVVLVGGSAITMAAWLDRVGAVLDAWYPGEEGGHAVAAVLCGDADPGGRLPITFPMAEGQLPLVYDHYPTGRGDDYVDLSGQPLFPFGFGLSYASFAYDSLRIAPDTMDAGDTAEVRLRVRNTGARDGEEVVQLYVRDVLASVNRPVLQLADFQRVRLAAGEEREVRLRVPPEALRLYGAGGRWVVEPGEFRILVGRSARDIRLRGTLTVR